MLDPAAVQPVLFNQSEVTFKRRLDGLPRGIFFDARVENLITRAQLLDDLLRMRILGERFEKIFLAFKNRRSARKTGLRHQSRGDPVARRRPGKTERFVDVFGILTPGIDPGRLRAASANAWRTCCALAL